VSTARYEHFRRRDRELIARVIEIFLKGNADGGKGNIVIDARSVRQTKGR
jgi:hypothetical protein